MASYSIQDLSKITGIKPHTIRMWEKRYGVIRPDRSDTNIRIYCDQDLRKLLNVSILTKNGYRISQVATLSYKELSDKVIDVTQALNNTAHEVEQLIVAMIELNEQKFEKTLSKAIFKLGFEDTFINIIYPFFNKVGTLWQIGTINPAQEHFISSLIRQKLIVAIDSLESSFDKSSRTFILFLNEHELHELGLLFYYFIIKKAGHRVIYLGPQVPLQDVQEIVEAHKPDFLFTSFVAQIDCARVKEYVEQLSTMLDGKTIFTTGLENYQGVILPKNLKNLKDGNEFKELLEYM